MGIMISTKFSPSASILAARLDVSVNMKSDYKEYENAVQTKMPEYVKSDASIWIQTTITNRINEVYAKLGSETAENDCETELA